jgi:hypothetical protein
MLFFSLGALEFWVDWKVSFPLENHYLEIRYTKEIDLHR